jgi:hypothetical protein
MTGRGWCSSASARSSKVRASSNSRVVLPAPGSPKMRKEPSASS